MQTTATTVVIPRQPGAAARMVAVFALGAVSSGGLVYAIMSRSTPVVVPAPSPVFQPVSQPVQPIVVQLVQPSAGLSSASGLPFEPPAGPSLQHDPSAFIGPPAPNPLVVVPEAANKGGAEVVVEPDARPATSPVIRPLPSPATPARIAGTKVNLNMASQAELEALPLVGPSMAKRIIEHRTKNGPFRQVKDLDKVKGVGEKTLARLTPLVYVDVPGDR